MMVYLRLGTFRRGGFFLALESGAPIIPITIRGTYALMPKGQWFARKGTVEIAFRDPVPAAAYGPETMAGLIERVRNEIGGEESHD